MNKLWFVRMVGLFMCEPRCSHMTLGGDSPKPTHHSGFPTHPQTWLLAVLLPSLTKALWCLSQAHPSSHTTLQLSHSPTLTHFSLTLTECRFEDMLNFKSHLSPYFFRHSFHDKYNKVGIYKLSWKKYPSTNIGRTGRNLRTQLTEH